MSKHTNAENQSAQSYERQLRFGSMLRKLLPSGSRRWITPIVMLLLLLGISVRILLAALQSTDALGRYLCVGIFAALFWQCIINLGMNLQVLPVIGVTLPFFSAGGSSVVMVYLCVGLVLAVSRKNRRKKLAVPIELEQV